MAETITCPRCKHEQPKGPSCASCGLDFRKYAEHLREKRAARAGRLVRCPYCKTEQPLRALCMKCGLDFKAYSQYIKRKKAGEDVAPPLPPAVAKTPAALDPTKPIELEDLFKRTWETFKDRWLTLVALTILYIVVVVASVFPIVFAVPFLTGEPDPVMLGALIGGIVLLAMIAGFSAMSILFAAATDKSLTIGSAIKTGLAKAPAFIWVMFLQGLIVTGGFILFAVPGFIFMVWFMFAPYIVFRENVRGMDALLKSREYVRGHGWDAFFKLAVIMVLYMVVGSVPLIGPLVGLPFMLLFIVMMYRDLVRIKGTEMPYPDDRWSRLKWPLTGLAGTLVPVMIIAAVLVPLISTIKNMSEVQQAGLQPFITDRQSGTVLSPDRDVYAPGEQITVKYSGMPGNAKDWITIAGAEAPDDSYGEYYYTEGNTEGVMEFGGLDPGQYEVRTFHDWPAGGYEIKARYPLVVKAGAEGDLPQLILRQKDFAPGEIVTVRFRVPPEFPAYGWAGIVSSALPHGNESLNRANTTVFKLIEDRTSGELSFDAPLKPGSYDVRLHDREGGSEVSHVSFSVSENNSPRTVRLRASSEAPIQVMVYISSLNYEAEVLLNNNTLYSIPGQRDMNYKRTVPATLIAGRNEFTVRYEALPEAWKAAIRIKVYTQQHDGTERILAQWSVLSPSGTKDFFIEVTGAGVKA